MEENSALPIYTDKDIVLRAHTTEVLNKVNEMLAVLPPYNARYILKRLSHVWRESQDSVSVITGSTDNP